MTARIRTCCFCSDPTGLFELEFASKDLFLWNLEEGMHHAQTTRFFVVLQNLLCNRCSRANVNAASASINSWTQQHEGVHLTIGITLLAMGKEEEMTSTHSCRRVLGALDSGSLGRGASTLMYMSICAWFPLSVDSSTLIELTSLAARSLFVAKLGGQL